MRISDWSSDVCSSDLIAARRCLALRNREGAEADQANLVALLERTRNRIEHGFDRLAGVVFAATRRIGPGADQFLLVHFLGTRPEEHTSELPSLMRTSYAVFCLTKKT